MESLINEKKKLYDTLLSFPPFFTYLLSLIQLAITRRIPQKASKLLGINDSQLLPGVYFFLNFSKNIINSSIS